MSDILLLAMERAVKISKEKMLSNAGGPFGAVIVQQNKIIAEGWNQVTSTYDPSAHAEVVAIRHACAQLHKFSLEDCILVTSCYPCPMCFSTALWARIPHIYYANTPEQAAKIGFDDKAFYTALSQPNHTKLVTLEHIQCTSAIEAFDLWQSKTDRVHY